MLKIWWNHFKRKWLPIRSSWRIVAVPAGYRIEHYHNKSILNPYGHCKYISTYPTFLEAESAIYAHTTVYETNWYYDSNGHQLGKTLAPIG